MPGVDIGSREIDSGDSEVTRRDEHIRRAVVHT